MASRTAELMPRQRAVRFWWETMPQCRGRHPHLGLASEPCGEQLRTLVLGASNLWFNSKLAALSLPVGGGSLGQLVYDHWAALDKMPVKEVLVYALASDQKLQAAFAGHDLDDIWDAVEVHRARNKPVPTADVLGPEWSALTTGSHAQTSPHFEAEHISSAPAALARSAVPAPHQGTVDRLNAAWRAQPDLPGSALAVASDATRTACGRRRRRPSRSS